MGLMHSLTQRESIVMTPATSTSVSAEILFPENISLWYGSADLARLALQMASICHAEPQQPNAQTSFTEVNLLATMITCYASGIFGSDEVQWATDTHPTVRLLARDGYLRPEAVRRFRRPHHGTVERALGRLLAATIASTCAFESEEDIQSAALMEARRRVQLAILFDLP